MHAACGSLGKVFLCEADDRQRRRRVQRRKDGGKLQFPEHRLVNQAMLPELRPAMHNAMPDGVKRRHLGVGKKSTDAGDRFALARNGTILVGE